VSLSTARTQVRRLFEKTHTRRLAELVKPLVSLPAVRADWEGG
jgi:DNA-binding CsgD family transcriptional regulator